jgi:cytoskeletal protein CcmA (bactofilin family)
MDNFNDVKISGMAKINGGKFRYVDISGMGEITSDVEAEKIDISGLGTIKGNTKTQKIKSSGSGSIEGNLECQSIKTSGYMKIEGRLKAEDTSTSGSLSVKDGIKAQKIRNRGYLYSGNGVESEDFDSKGAFKIEGLLNSNKVDIFFGGYCYAREIGGEEISVRHSGFFDFSFILGLFGSKDRLESDLIEGNAVFLEYTDVKVVRGNRIKIGDKCIVEQVEYTESLDIHPNSVVKTQNKI